MENECRTPSRRGSPLLTRRQHIVYQYLQERQQRSLPAPTLDELCAALKLRSRGSMHKHVQALVQAGLVEPMGGKQRGVQLRPEPQHAPTRLPLLGYIAAGRPIEAITLPEHIGVPDQLVRDQPCYVLRVKGDSMIEDGILDGDWVVVEARAEARNGEIVVALIDGYETTLKRIAQQPGQVVLYPANRDLPPMAFSPQRVQIQGVVVGQMRSYR